MKHGKNRKPNNILIFNRLTKSVFEKYVFLLYALKRILKRSNERTPLAGITTSKGWRCEEFNGSKGFRAYMYRFLYMKSLYCEGAKKNIILNCNKNE